MKKLLVFSTLVLPFLIPQPVSAHAFGKLYNLPVPFWLYLYGAAAAIVVSFLIIGFFITKHSTVSLYPTRKLPRVYIFQNPFFLASMKLMSIIFFFLTIATGLWGTNTSSDNFNMTFFWIIFVLGFSYLVALVGNIWDSTNPWRILSELLETVSGGMIGNGFVDYPEKLAYYPALVTYFLFIWFELSGQISPFTLSLLLIQYTFLNILGFFIFGKKNWFHYCEFFSVFFRLIGTIAPIEYVNGSLYIRPPFVGLLKGQAEHFSLLMFILFMLASTAFDGFRETNIWYQVYRQTLGENVDYQLFNTVGLFLSPFVFLLLYIIFIALAKVLTQSTVALRDLLLKFAFSLIPIAIVYNVAHYYTLLLTQGQEIVRLLSDPFGTGQDLFHTAGYKINLTFIDAGVTWHLQVAFILLGHIAGVYLSHVIALRIFSSHKKALISQFPMLVLMVVYTMIGLWILSQPITSAA